MANSNFIVQNGLTVGPVTIEASTGHINTTGNISTSGTIISTSVAPTELSANLIVGGTANIGGAVYGGLGAEALIVSGAGYVGLTNATAVFTANANAFVQFGVKNKRAGAAASTDLIAYSDDGDNDSGWVDMGITSSAFNDPLFTITGPGTGYLFYSAPATTTGTGDLLIGTSANGANNDVVLFSGGFDAGNERVRVVGTPRAGTPAGIEFLGTGGIIYAGPNAANLTIDASGYVGLTDGAGIFTGNVNAFVQFALKNLSSGADASTDLIAYSSDGDNDSGWIDLGATSKDFSDPLFTITGPGTGYLFYSAPATTTGTGDLLIGTDATGSHNDVIMFAGGFDAGNEHLRVVGTARSGHQKGVEILATTTSTSSTTGALRVAGGLGVGGNLHLLGGMNVEGNVSSIQGAFYVGTNASDLTIDGPGYVGLTNATAIFVGDTNDFVQFAIKNKNAGTTASTDLIAYSSDGDNDSGWIDLGATSHNYNDPAFTITGPGTGYLFYSAPVSTTGTGDLLIGTDATGSQNDVIMFAGGFDAGREHLRVVGTARVGHDEGVEILADTPSTTAITGALRVTGGVGVLGDLNVGGNVGIIGTISIGGAGSSLSTTTLSVTDPMVKLASNNPADVIDVGIFGATGISTTLTANLNISATTIDVAATGTFPSTGIIHIEDEEITYTGKTSVTFTGCTRGTNGTSAAAHLDTTTVYQSTFHGVVRDASDGIFKLFSGLTGVAPTTTVDFSNAGLAYAPIKVGTANIAVTTTSTSRTTGALIVGGGVGVTGNIYVGTIYVGSSVAPSAYANAIVSGTQNADGFVQVQIQNINSGASASTDFIATTDQGNDTSHFIDTGINGSGFSSAAWTISGAQDGYTYVNGGNLTLGTDTLGKTVKIHTGGHLAANVVATFNASATASTTSATGALVVVGGIGSTGSYYVNSVNNAIAIGNGGTNGTGDIGASGATFNTIWAKATTAQYADLAENYQADAEYAPGTVVHFGGEFEVTACDTDGCTSVAGIVSTNPAHLMNTGLEGANVVALALTGRVPCQVQGTVRKGDLMVSAGNGRARAEANPKVGSVIGKALANSEGDATIEVVVGVR
jgi:hypothetical protein